MLKLIHNTNLVQTTLIQKMVQKLQIYRHIYELWIPQKYAKYFIPL